MAYVDCGKLWNYLPCIMDPVINGLSLESPWWPSRGKALLINPEEGKKQNKTKHDMTILKHIKHARTYSVCTAVHKYPQMELLPCRGVLCPSAPPSCHGCVSAHGLFGGFGCFPWCSLWLLDILDSLTMGLCVWQ